MRLILPIILVLAALGIGIGFTNPTYKKVKTIKEEKVQFTEAVEKFDTLIRKRDEIIARKNSFSPDDLKKLEKVLPDNVNNIRLIIEIQEIANRYAFLLENVKFDTNQTLKKTQTTSGGATPSTPQQALQSAKPYESFNFDFRVTGTYENFLKFLKDLEASNRLIDVESVTFSGKEGSTTFDFQLKMKTYWLKS